LDGCEAVLGPGGADVVPCGSLRERLRTDVRGATRVVAVGPVLLGVGHILRRGAAMTDGGDRRRHDDPLDAGGQARLDHAQGARAPARPPARSTVARTAGSRPTSRTVVRTSWPRRSNSATHHPPTKPVPPVTRTVAPVSLMIGASSR